MSRRREVVVRQLTGWHLPAIAWQRLRRRRVGLMDEGRASSLTRALSRAWGAAKIDLGSVVLQDPMSSPWTDLDAVVNAVLRDADEAAHDFPGSEDDVALWRMSLRREVAKHGFDQLIAIRWVTPGNRLVYFGASALDARIAQTMRDQVVKTSLWPSRFSHGLTNSVGAVAGRMALRRKHAGNDGMPAVQQAAFPTRAPALAESRAHVLFVLNKGLNYGGLYRYDQFFSDDPTSPFHERNMSYVASEPRTLENGAQAFGMHQLLGERSPTRRILESARLRLSRARDRDLMTHRQQFLRRAHAYSEGLRNEFPDARLAIFAFDIQVPIEFSVALRRRGIRTIASHERPQAGLVPYLTLVADRLLTPSAEFSRLLEVSPHASVRECIPCGFWRTDRLVQERQKARRTRPMILVLPYELLSENVVARMPSELTVAGFTHFLDDVTALAEEFTHVDIVVRAKTDAWITDPRVAPTVARLLSHDNVQVSRDYDSPLESYRLAAMATLVIGKYTSLVEEALACGIPAFIHDFTHNAHEGMCQMSSYLPTELFLHGRQELLAKARMVIADDGAAFHAAWGPHRESLYGSMNDGHVCERTMASATELLSSYE